MQNGLQRAGRIYDGKRTCPPAAARIENHRAERPPVYLDRQRQSVHRAQGVRRDV